MVTITRSKVKSKSHHDVAQPLANVPTKYTNFLPITVSEIWPRQDFIGQGHYDTAKGQVKVTPWHTPTLPKNVPTRYQLLTPYGFRDIAWTRFYRSRSLQQNQRSNQGHTMMLYIYTS